MPARPGSKNAEAVLGIMVGDTIDETGKSLLAADLRIGVSWSVRQNCRLYVCGFAQAGDRAATSTQAAVLSTVASASDSDHVRESESKAVGPFVMPLPTA